MRLMAIRQAGVKPLALSACRPERVVNDRAVASGEKWMKWEVGAIHISRGGSWGHPHFPGGSWGHPHFPGARGLVALSLTESGWPFPFFPFYQRPHREQEGPVKLPPPLLLEGEGAMFPLVP